MGLGEMLAWVFTGKTREELKEPWGRGDEETVPVRGLEDMANTTPIFADEHHNCRGSGPRVPNVVPDAVELDVAEDVEHPSPWGLGVVVPGANMTLRIGVEHVADAAPDMTSKDLFHLRAAIDRELNRRRKKKSVEGGKEALVLPGG